MFALSSRVIWLIAAAVTALESAEHDSQERYHKRPHIAQLGEQPWPNDQHTPWRRWEDAVLLDDPSSDRIRMVIEKKAVSMRKSDYWLNATELLTLAGKNKSERDYIMIKLRKNTKVYVPQKRGRLQSWISYPDGVHLCKHLGLTDALQPLLEYGFQKGAKLDDNLNFLDPKFPQVRAGETKLPAATTRKSVCDDRADKKRPRCDRCTKRHFRCDRNHICGNCSASNQDCVYNSEITGRLRPRAEPTKRAKPHRSTGGLGNSRVHEDKDLEAKMERTAKISPQGTSHGPDRSVEKSPGTTLDEATNEESDEASDEATDDKILTDLYGSAGTVSPAKSERSCSDELSFHNGSFLPPFNDLFVQSEQQEYHQSFKGQDLGCTVTVDDEELWIDAAINDARGSDEEVVGD